ncbi:MAG: hypothetical protein NUV82_01875, partial [Candidatus Komeilibacteria bacterium]|nr:hypothetical protein [Candidatus Komeilibacteria bacterium]
METPDKKFEKASVRPRRPEITTRPEEERRAENTAVDDLLVQDDDIARADLNVDQMVNDFQRAKPVIVKKIEDILAEDLSHIYTELNPEQQEQFRREGEKAARKISVLLRQAKVRIRVIAQIIKKWLT